MNNSSSKTIYAIARLMVSGVWLYHGLVPKLLFKHPDEFAPLLGAGMTPDQAAWIVKAAGVTEMLAGVALLVFWRVQAGFWITIILMTVALVSVGFTAPQLLTAAFNPVSLNLCMIALSVIGLLTPTPKEDARECRPS